DNAPPAAIIELVPGGTSRALRTGEEAMSAARTSVLSISSLFALGVTAAAACGTSQGPEAGGPGAEYEGGSSGGSGSSGSSGSSGTGGGTGGSGSTSGGGTGGSGGSGSGSASGSGSGSGSGGSGGDGGGTSSHVCGKAVPVPASARVSNNNPILPPKWAF